MNDRGKIENLLKMAVEDLKDIEIYVQEYSTFLPLAVCTINPLGIILNSNQAFQKLTGYKEIEAIGKKMKDLFLNKENFKDLIKEKTLKGKSSLTRKMTLLTKEDKKMPVSMAISIRRDEEDNFIGHFIALSDITAFEDLRKNLEKKVKERTKQLQERVDELEKFRRLTEGRELRMVELKEEIKKLKEELEKQKGRK